MQERKTMTFRKNLLNTMYLVKYILGKQNGKLFVFLKLITSIYNALIPILYTVVSGLLINELCEERNITKIVIYVMIITCTPLLTYFMNRQISKKIFKLNAALALEFKIDYFDRVLSMEYETIEIPEIQVKKMRASMALLNSTGIIDLLCRFVSSAFALITVVSIVSSLNPFILIFVSTILIINYFINKKNNNDQHNLNKERSLTDMQLGIIDNVLESFDHAKEVRLFQIKDFLLDHYISHSKKLHNIDLKQLSRGNKASDLLTLTSFMQQLALYGVTLYEVLKNAMPVGSMTIYMGTVGQFAGTVGGLLNSYLELSKKSLITQELIDFMNMPLMKNNSGNLIPEFDENSTIEFRNVSFKYSGSERYALENCNITIHGNEKLCIVGENGAGKSTFIKLLVRLYSPSEGAIYLNGRNINEYDVLAYQRMFSTVFQDYTEYPMTVAQNIAFDDTYNINKLKKVCSECGIEDLIEKLPHKYDTYIGKEIFTDGFNPSGGESQRIAIARALYSERDIYILDEPTAALDPMAEYEIYTQFHNMIKNKCAVLITHRLSAVQLADKVAVFADGQIAEYGTHKELYNKNGIYTEMFDKQSQFYRDDT